MENNTSKSEYEKAKLFKILGILAITLAFMSAVYSVILLKSYRYVGTDTNPARTIQVSGSGEVVAVPDTATFTFSVIEEADTVEEVQAQAAEKNNAVLSRLEEFNIEERDIKTIGYNLHPRYEFRRSSINLPGNERVLAGFEVRQSVEVKIRDLDIASEVLSAIGQTGVSNISSLNLSVEDPAELEREAREKAISDAKTKAEELARDLDVRLGKLVVYNEVGNNQPHLSRQDSAFGLGGAEEAIGVPPQISLGENIISSNIVIVYEIR